MEFEKFPTEIRRNIISPWAADRASRATGRLFECPLSMFTLSTDWQDVIRTYVFADITLRKKDFFNNHHIHTIFYIKGNF